MNNNTMARLRVIDQKPVLSFASKSAWATWLKNNHAKSPGVWVRLAKKGSGLKSVTRDDALDLALCYGWIDGQGRSDGEQYWLQKFTPRTKRSIWSKRNREKVQALIAGGEMQLSGHAEIERAKSDGRWERAYDSPSTMTIPEDLAAAFERNKRAKAFFETLDSRNRYAVLFRIATAKKTETRARRIEQFVAMLSRNEKLHA
jgi:uncharacterized protein YdeI (YjbR/CyaY-like superfamily)